MAEGPARPKMDEGGITMRHLLRKATSENNMLLYAMGLGILWIMVAA